MDAYPNYHQTGSRWREMQKLTPFLWTTLAPSRVKEHNCFCISLCSSPFFLICDDELNSLKNLMSVAIAPLEQCFHNCLLHTKRDLPHYRWLGIEILRGHEMTCKELSHSEGRGNSGSSCKRYTWVFMTLPSTHSCWGF